MLRRLAREEAGMTMGLVVIMIVLIGVMGAGLLTFVNRDLETVIEVNRGQRALEWSDAGIEAAKQQLLIDADPTRYDSSTGDNSEWAYNVGAVGSEGKTLNLNGTANRVRVFIQHLRPATAAAEVNNANFAPELLPAGATQYPANRNYFKITAQGTADEANRRIEAIYRTRDLGFPMAWYSSSDIDFNGNSFAIANVSAFTGGDILNLRGDNITGCDKVYGDWSNPTDSDPRWNSTPRNAGTVPCGDGTSGVPTGVGTVGTIEYDPPGPAGRPGTRDYDKFVTGDGSNTSAYPDFVPNTWTVPGSTQSSNDISYPFNPDPNEQVDLATLRAAAVSGANGSRLITRRPGDSFTLNDYPSPSSVRTVYYVEFVNPDGTYTNPGTGLVDKGQVDYTSDLDDFVNTNGTIVILNGDFDGSPSSDNFRGILIQRDPIDNDTVKLEYTSTGNFDPAGFANVEGSVDVGGDSDSVVPADVLNRNRPGFYSLQRWSWRECYNTNCN